MDWLQIITMIVTNIGFVTVMFLWNRSESRSDMRRCEDMIMAIHGEIKDFHARLCVIEERRNER
jgi:hypothetical protein